MSATRPAAASELVRPEWMRGIARRPATALAAVAVFAIVVRVALILATPGYHPVYDAADYDLHAASIAAGHGYPPTVFGAPGTPSAFRPPGYPYVLGAVYAVSGQRWKAGRVLGALLGGATVLLLALLANELWGRRAGLAAGGLAAVAPPLAFVSVAELSETLFLPLMLGAILATIRARRASSAPNAALADDPASTRAIRARGLPYAALAGALAGAAALTRTSGVVVVLAVAIGLATAMPRRPLLAPAVAILLAAAVLVPWTVRNADAFGRFVPISTQDGFSIGGTYNPIAAQGPDTFQAAWRTPDTLPMFAPLLHNPTLNEAQVSASFRHTGLRYARDHPGYVLEALRLNTERLFNVAGQKWMTDRSDDEMGIPAGARGTVTVTGWVLALLALAGIAVALRARLPRGPVFLWLVPLGLYLTMTPLTGAPRHRAVLDPFLVLLAAPALVALWDAARGRRREA